LFNNGASTAEVIQRRFIRKILEVGVNYYPKIDSVFEENLKISWNGNASTGI
jgi:hypothetical protein